MTSVLCYHSMTKTTVVHLLADDYDVLIDRTTKWGNPFVIGRDGTRTEVIELYRKWIHTQPSLMDSLHQLEGKRLGCWCKSKNPKPCHGDVLVELVNSRFEQGGLF